MPDRRWCQGTYRVLSPTSIVRLDLFSHVRLIWLSEKVIFLPYIRWFLFSEFLGENFCTRWALNGGIPKMLGLFPYKEILPNMPKIQCRIWYQYFILDPLSLDWRREFGGSAVAIPPVHQPQHSSSTMLRITVLSPSFAIRYVLFWFSGFF